MALFPEARCAVALGWDCEMIGEYAAAGESQDAHGHLAEATIGYMLNLATIAEQAGVRLQYFILGQTFEQPVSFLHDLVQRGHALDQHTYSHWPLVSDDLTTVRRELHETGAAFAEHLGFRPAGVRGPGGYAQGLEGHTEAQQAILDEGMTFVSCHYATRSPQGPYDLAADRNAVLLTKHHQPRRYATGLLEVPISGYSDRHFLDGLGRPLDEWILHLRDCLDFAYDMGGLLYAPALHPDTHLRHDPGCAALTALLEHAARKREPVRFCTYREVAQAALID